ncbi:hypothetical protein [Rhodococcus qingshengii]|jgi:hypothetical protein|uniref:hypothetical protein n=1 Tax=Rhodococcus qingshengii TaxID=334542 RepID=UPI001C21A3F2|nr:hypothetical protein [Rhodococcus qingshengii]QXC46150.1 hypothetical protein KSE96_30760 [Rhodococcus qingshengii]
MQKPPPWPTESLRTWATEALEQFIADVERGVVAEASAANRFLTLEDAHAELAQRRRRQALHHLAPPA